MLCRLCRTNELHAHEPFERHQLNFREKKKTFLPFRRCPRAILGVNPIPFHFHFHFPWYTSSVDVQKAYTQSTRLQSQNDIQKKTHPRSPRNPCCRFLAILAILSKTNPIQSRPISSNPNYPIQSSPIQPGCPFRQNPKPSSVTCQSKEIPKKPENRHSYCTDMMPRSS